MAVANQIGTILGLLTISTASLAFIAGLSAFLGVDPRFRESSYSILSVLFLFCISTLFLTIALALELNSEDSIGLVFVEVGLVVFAVGWMAIFRAFFILHGRVSHMRDRRYAKYIFPLSMLNDLRSKKYALTVPPRKSIHLGPYNLSEEAMKVMGKGYNFLFIGPRHILFQFMALEILIDGIVNNETANYVCCDRPPYQIWRWLQHYDEAQDANFRKYLIIIDAFSPHLGYDDEILKAANREVINEGVQIIQAKGIAGVHSAGSTAWYKTKEMLRKEGIKDRLPNRVVYDNISSLKVISSPDLVRSFFQHVAAAERKYGMITIFLEYEDADQEILAAIENVVDATLVFSENARRGGIQVEVKKISSLDPGNFRGKRSWPLKMPTRTK